MFFTLNRAAPRVRGSRKCMGRPNDEGAAVLWESESTSQLRRVEASRHGAPVDRVGIPHRQCETKLEISFHLMTHTAVRRRMCVPAFCGLSIRVIGQRGIAERSDMDNKC